MPKITISSLKKEIEANQNKNNLWLKILSATVIAHVVLEIVLLVN